MNMNANQKPDKRTRLVDAADQLFHEQGVNITTLANIAALANVPLGNVYYYFRSKESIVLTVIEQRRKTIHQLFATWENTCSTAKERLKAFIAESIAFNPKTMAYGDMLGGLCQELGKQGGEIALASAALMKEVLHWCENQFKAMGKTEQSETLALHLLSSVQGINLLTLTFKDPAWVEKKNNSVNHWLEQV